MKKKKKILLVSTYEENGGAAIACKRTFNALKQSEDIEVKLLVLLRDTDDEGVYELFKSNLFKRARQRLYLAVEQLYLRPKINDPKYYFQFSCGFFGYSIANHDLVKWADIINIQWVHQGFLSINGIQELCNLGKPVYWTMHDMWAYSGGEHYVGSNESYKHESGNCLYMKKKGPKDFSHTIWKKKKEKLSGNKNLKFIGPSSWMKNCCDSSSLFQNHECFQIPYPYERLNTESSGKNNDKINILFGASNNLDERKGFKYCIESINQLSKENKSKIRLFLFGKGSEQDLSMFQDVEIKHFGFLKHKELVDLYCQSDILLMPTLEDNLPNTVIESMAYHNAVVGFDTGGMSDMAIHNENGYLCPVGDSNGLKQFMEKLIEEPDQLKAFQIRSYEMFIEKFSVQKVNDLYKQLS